MSATKLHVFNLGDMKMDKSLLISRATVASVSKPAAPAIFASFSVTAFLLEHEEGLVLFDAGCHPDSMGKNGHWTAFQQEHYPFFGTPEQNLVRQVERLGVKPADVRYIVLSHMHNDHAGCLEFFPNATVYVHEDEFAAAMQAYARGDQETSYVLKDIDGWIGKHLDWRFVRRDQGDIPFMKNVTILNFGPGHSSGMMGLEIELANSGTIILASDSIYCQENFYPEFKPLGITFDSKNARATLDRIYWLSKQKDAQVFFGHDSTQTATLKLSPDGYYD
ncbi:MAG: N-acyl homoserine lactonase family protein [Planctomycetaceae bacterium]|nr:N-acyl homoserine lactonase family protein [Planctomycetaceae bacterium]